MNPNPSTIRILCFGDSNTWGRSGSSVDRYPANVRWTGLFQQKLGDSYEIIEEGLRSRTTNIDDPDNPGRNGLTYLLPCLESQQPLDAIILWLGTNDLKAQYNRQASDVTSAISHLIEVIKQNSQDRNGNPSRIVLVSPPLIKESALKPETYFKAAGEKSKELAPLFKELAEKEGCVYVDLAPIVQAGDFDGVHLEPDQHPKVAEVFYQLIQSMEQVR